MAAVHDVDELIEQFHLAQGEYVKGNLEPMEKLFSHREDVTLANPLGPPARGWQQVEDALHRASAQIHDGEVLGAERISEVETADLAYIVEIERDRVKVGDADVFASSSLRVTSIFRREDGEWRLVHRHADPITAPRSVESVLER